MYVVRLEDTLEPGPPNLEHQTRRQEVLAVLSDAPVTASGTLGDWRERRLGFEPVPGRWLLLTVSGENSGRR